MFRIQLQTKKSPGTYVYSPLDLGVPNIAMFEILYRNGKVDPLSVRALPKVRVCQKFLQIKVVKDSISYKKVSGRISLSSPKGELECRKDCHFQKILNYTKQQNRQNLELNAAKSLYYIIKGFKLKLLRIQFRTNNQQAHMSYKKFWAWSSKSSGLLFLKIIIKFFSFIPQINTKLS